MSRVLMGLRCPGAAVLGPAMLVGWRFVITRDGYASIARFHGGQVHGVLWRLTIRDLAAINAYESVDSGLYRRRVLAVRCERRTVAALVYVAPAERAGPPRPGYLSVVLAAAGDWRLPEPYIHSLSRWSATRWRGARPPDTGEVG